MYDRIHYKKKKKKVKITLKKKKGTIANGEKSLKGDFDRVRKNTFSKTFYFIWEYS